MKPATVYGILLLAVLATGCGQPPRGDKGDVGQPGTPGEPGAPGLCIVQPAPDSPGVYVTCPDGSQVHLQDGATFICPTPEPTPVPEVDDDKHKEPRHGHKK